MAKSYLVVRSKSNVENKTAKTPQSVKAFGRSRRTKARPGCFCFQFFWSTSTQLCGRSFSCDCKQPCGRKSRRRVLDRHRRHVCPTDCLLLPESVSPFRTYLFVFLQRRSAAVWPCWPFSLKPNSFISSLSTASLGPGHRAVSVVGKPKMPSTSPRGTPRTMSPGQSGDPACARSAS